MWPDLAEVEAMTEAGENALADIYGLMLSIWAPQQAPFVLPTLSGGGELPPDFDAFASQTAQARWNWLVEDWIMPAMTAIWSWALVQAAEAAGNPLPVPPLTAAGVKRPDLVAELTALAFQTRPSQMKLAMLMVANDARNAEKLQRFLGERRPMAQSLPSRIRDMMVGFAATAARHKKYVSTTEVREQLAGWLGQVYDITGPGRVTREKIINRVTGEWSGEYYVVPRRRAALEFFQPWRDMANESGLQAAGIINQATLIAASQSDVDFDIVWIARMDEHTRDTHFAADGQRIELGAEFRVGRATLSYPGDISGPPGEVRNCRCRLGMVKWGEPMPYEQKRSPEQRAEIERRREMGIVRAREDPDGIGFITPPANTALTAAAEEGIDMTEIEATDLAEVEVDGETFRTFSDGVMAFIGTPTSDGRLLHTDIEFTVRPTPLPLMWMKQSSEGHMHAYTVGVIEVAERNGELVVASGYLLNTPEADEAAQQLEHGVTRPSVDLAAIEWMLTGEDGQEISEEQWWELPRDAKVFQTITKAELIGATLVSTPAFGATSVRLNEDREARGAALVAAAAARFEPRVYDHRLFEDPGLSSPTLPTLGEDGRVFGHLACWGACHRSIQTECTFAPRSPSNYAHFHTSPAVRLDDGRRLPVGRLTVGTGHAPDHLPAGPAIAHYDNTGTCFALVRVGEDSHGIWFSGVTAPWATPEQIEQGLSAPLSGDWRNLGEGLDLVAALAVNTPGFVARGREDDQGRPVALVASLGPAPASPRHSSAPTITQIQQAVENALEAREFRAETQAALAEAARKVGHPPRPKTPTQEVGELLANRR